MQIVLKNIETGKKMPLVQRLNKEEEAKINSIKNSVLGDFVKFESLNNSLISKIPQNGNNGNNTTINSDINLNLNDSKLSVNQKQPKHKVTRELLKEINLANSYVKGVSPNDIDINLSLSKLVSNTISFLSVLTFISKNLYFFLIILKHS